MSAQTDTKNAFYDPLGTGMFMGNVTKMQNPQTQRTATCPKIVIHHERLHKVSFLNLENI